MKKICLRIDDIGASTKQFEVYSKNPIGNILYLKYFWPFKAWGPYEEMRTESWEKVFDLLNKYNAKLTVGVTASWVEENGSMIPFPDKYPHQAHLLKQASKENLIEIASHGLTHCVVGKHLPKHFSSNRKYHREFWDWLPRNLHYEHLEKSQSIFYRWLGQSPTTLIPPGNVYSIDTLKAAEKFGIKRINSYMNFDVQAKIEIINDKSVDAFHDRELVLEGLSYFENKLSNYDGDVKYIFLRDL